MNTRSKSSRDPVLLVEEISKEVERIRQIAPPESLEGLVARNIVNVFRFANYVCARVALSDRIGNYRVWDRLRDEFYGYATLEGTEHYEREGEPPREVEAKSIVVCVPATSTVGKMLPYVATVEVLKYLIRKERIETMEKIAEARKRMAMQRGKG